jgi:hypothetical protein
MAILVVVAGVVIFRVIPGYNRPYQTYVRHILENKNVQKHPKTENRQNAHKIVESSETNSGVAMESNVQCTNTESLFSCVCTSCDSLG